MTKRLLKSAVTIVLSRDESGKLLALVGRRNPKSRFLGGFYAFPGGGLEEQDGDVERDGEDACLRNSAARELREETGLEIDSADLLAAGRRITPPFAPRRFDSLMYVAAFDEPQAPTSQSDELLDLEWAHPTDLHARWREREIRVAPPLIPILEALAETNEESFGAIAAKLEAVNDEMEADGPRIEFVPDVLMIPVETPTLPPATHTNCYLIGASDFVILDPGCSAEREVARLLRHIRRRAVSGRVPLAVVLTHHHVDHVGAAHAVCDEFEIPLWAHESTFAALGLRVGQGGRALEDEDTIELSGGEVLRVLHTPGHAEGHVALFEAGSRSLFAGDLVSGVSTILVGSGEGDLDRYLASLERARDLPASTLFPAHGPPITVPKKAFENVIRHRHERERRILEAVSEGVHEVSRIVERAYEDTPGAARGLAAQQALAHLSRLAGAGRVKNEGGRWLPA